MRTEGKATRGTSPRAEPTHVRGWARTQLEQEQEEKRQRGRRSTRAREGIWIGRPGATKGLGPTWTDGEASGACPLTPTWIG